MAPANLEDDDTGASTIPQISGPNQLHQAPPPRPPRQQRAYAASVVGVHVTNDSPGHASMAVSGTNVSLIPNMNQAMPSNGTVTNVNVGLNMNQPPPIGSATNVKSTSNVSSANKAIPLKYYVCFIVFVYVIYMYGLISCFGVLVMYFSYKNILEIRQMVTKLTV